MPDHNFPFLPVFLAAAAFGAGVAVAYALFRRERRGFMLELRSLWERLDAMFYRSPLAVLLCEPEAEAGRLRVIDANEQACQLHGATREQLLAAEPRALGETAEEQAGARLWLRAPRSAGLWRGERRLRRSDGVELAVAFVGTRVEIGGRDLVLVVERDVSEQRQAEAALKDSEQRLRQLIQSANCLLWKAQVTDVDGALQWSFDIPRSGLRQRLLDAAGLPFQADVLWRRFDIPEFGEMDLRCRSALQGDVPRYQQEFRILVPAGTIWLQEEVEVQRLGPSAWSLVGVVVDITRLKETEAAVRASEERNRLVLEASNDGIWDYDVKTGRMTASERCRAMLGLAAEAMPREPEAWLARIHDEDLPAVKRAWARFHATGEPEVFQARHRHADESWRWLMVRLIAVREPGGPLRRIIGSHTDVSELKRADGELQQGRRLRAIGELVGGIAHEFNNLLTPMLLQTTMMRDGFARGGDLKEQLKPVIAAIGEARELTQRILTFGRRASVNVETLDFRAAVHDNLELLRHTIDRRVQLKILPGPGGLWISQNRTDVAQIVINLILNARDTLLEKAAGRPPAEWVPSIEIELTTVERVALSAGVASRRCHVLTVRDNGMGMTEEVRERIFEPFYTTKEVGQGTGLGLATVWHLIKTMGGEVEVETQAGGGSEFHVLLPAVEAAVPDAEPGATAVRVGADEGSRLARILLADDQPDVATTLSQILERWGHTVTVVSDGSAAMRELALRPRDFDVCITDLNMPGATGFDVVRMIRTQELPVKVVVIGGYLTAQVRRTLAELRVDATVPKPFSMEDITAALRSCGW